MAAALNGRDGATVDNADRNTTLIYTHKRVTRSTLYTYL